MMHGRQRGTRILLYSHDTSGPDHLRRSCALAAALTADDPAASALILTGSSVTGGFAFPERVDHVRLPGVIRRSDGSWVSAALGLDIDEITTLRARLIQSAVTAYDPDMLIVDTEPAGFRGELLPALEALIVQRRARIVLGLRDVLEDSELLAAEWAGTNAVEAAGGDGDSVTMVDLMLLAYEMGASLEPQAVLVHGPLLSGDIRAEFEDRVDHPKG